MSILAPTVRGAMTRSTSGTGVASGSHTPATGDFLIAAAYVHTSGGTNFTDTATCAGNGQTWTKRAAALSADGKQYLAVFTAGPVASPSAGTTTVTVNTAVTEAWVTVVGFAALASTLEQTTPYVAAAGAAQAASTAPAVSIGAPADPSNARFVFWGHKTAEVTTPRSGWTELGDSQTSPGSGASIALEGQYQAQSSDNSTSASWTSNVVSIYALVEVKNGKVMTAVNTNAYDDTSDTTVTTPNAESDWHQAGTYLYNERPVDRYGAWG
jgi:hypothetical protein